MLNRYLKTIFPGVLNPRMVIGAFVNWTLSRLFGVLPQAAGAGSMKALSPEELQELRKEIAGLDLPVARQDELIRLIDSIVTSWVDQAFGIESAQLSLSARANYAFAAGQSHGNVGASYEREPSAPGNGGAVIPGTSKNRPRP